MAHRIAGSWRYDTAIRRQSPVEEAVVHPQEADRHIRDNFEPKKKE
jgi:hypothetical protein